MVMKLSASQIQVLDNIRFDRAASDKTLDIALQFHTNLRVEISKKDTAFWKELADQYDLVLAHNKYEIGQDEGFVAVLLVEEEKDK